MPWMWAAKSNLLRAISDRRIRQSAVDRLKPLASSGVVPGKQIITAESELKEADIQMLSAQRAFVNLGLPVNVYSENDTIETIADRLRFLGIPAETARQLDPQTTSANLFPVRSTTGRRDC